MTFFDRILHGFFGRSSKMRPIFFLDEPFQKDGKRYAKRFCDFVAMGNAILVKPKISPDLDGKPALTENFSARHIHQPIVPTGTISTIFSSTQSQQSACTFCAPFCVPIFNLDLTFAEVFCGLEKRRPPGAATPRRPGPRQLSEGAMP